MQQVHTSVRTATHSQRTFIFVIISHEPNRLLLFKVGHARILYRISKVFKLHFKTSSFCFEEGVGIRIRD